MLYSSFQRNACIDSPIVPASPKERPRTPDHPIKGRQQASSTFAFHYVYKEGNHASRRHEPCGLGVYVMYNLIHIPCQLRLLLKKIVLPVTCSTTGSSLVLSDTTNWSEENCTFTGAATTRSTRVEKHVLGGQRPTTLELPRTDWAPGISRVNASRSLTLLILFKKMLQAAMLPELLDFVQKQRLTDEGNDARVEVSL